MLVRVWVPSLVLRREVIRLMCTSHHPVSAKVIKQVMFATQTYFVPVFRIDRCLEGLVHSGIVEKVVTQRTGGSQDVTYRLAAGIGNF
jgi:hypothetical protein